MSLGSGYQQPHDSARGAALQPVNGLADTVGASSALKRKQAPEPQSVVSPHGTPSLQVQAAPARSIQSTFNFFKSTPNACAVAPDEQNLKTASATAIRTPREDPHDVPRETKSPEFEMFLPFPAEGSASTRHDSPARGSTPRRSADPDPGPDPNSDSQPHPQTHAHAPTHAALFRPRDVQDVWGERYVRASAPELDILREFTPARVGVLRGESCEPELGLESAAAWAERERALVPLVPIVEKPEGNAAVEANEERWGIWRRTRPWGSRAYGQPNTAPTAAYAALLLDAFGPGSVLRGEGPKPVEKPNRGITGGDKKKQKKRKMQATRSASEASTVSASVSSAPEAMDVDAEVAAADEGAPSRVDEWIVKIQVVVKGKKQIAREDLEALADTLWMISEMSETEGRALGDNGPVLKESLVQLAQLEDVPFGDEYGVRYSAGQLVKFWPTY
ncbi:hypothetical protein B0H12DRAFT_1238287 [Mycena haematopus]|nr:hypothetical protein B0H12DRAFT_1238287 [Mycena haematopus]